VIARWWWAGLLRAGWLSPLSDTDTLHLHLTATATARQPHAARKIREGTVDLHFWSKWIGEWVGGQEPVKAVQAGWCAPVKELPCDSAQMFSVSLLPAYCTMHAWTDG
jgi:hypothetical protein